MPPEDAIYFSELSKQSLFYMTTERIQHKLILVDERTGSVEADYSIRTLLSRRELRKAVAMKDANGEMETVIREIKGPISYIESTTDVYLDPENENRCLVVYVDDSREQTKRIQEAQKGAFTPEGRRRQREAHEIIRRHQVAQQLLAPCKIDIPFVEWLTFPTHWCRTRRDHHKFLLLLSTIAYLHQYQRKQYQEGSSLVVVAEAKDYEIAYDLAPVLLRSAVSDLTDKHQELLAGIDRYVEAEVARGNIGKEDVIFTRGQIAHFLEWPLHLIRSFMPRLLDLEYLIQLGNAAKGATFKYRRNYHVPDPSNPLSWLISPAELRRKIAQSGERKA